MYTFKIRTYMREKFIQKQIFPGKAMCHARSLIIIHCKNDGNMRQQFSLMLLLLYDYRYTENYTN